MGGNVLTINIWRFSVLVLVQGLVLSGIDLNVGWLRYLHILIYPVFIMFLPLRTPPIGVIGLGFLIGLTVDLFTNTIGMHAMAGSFTGLMRTFALRLLSPANGYNPNVSPTRPVMGSAWIVRYVPLMMAFHLLYFFSVEAFTFFNLGQILKNFMVSYPFSVLVVLLIAFVTNTKE